MLAGASGLVRFTLLAVAPFACDGWIGFIFGPVGILASVVLFLGPDRRIGDVQKSPATAPVGIIECGDYAERDEPVLLVAGDCDGDCEL